MVEHAQIVADLSQGIEPVESSLLQIAQRHLDNLTKPIGSLGQLEQIAARLFAIRNGQLSLPVRKSVYVCAADHGIAAEGVSAYPSEVTAQMVLNFLAGGAAINVLARLHGAKVHVIDVGVNADLSHCEGLVHRKVRKGSRNMLQEAAMSEDECARALQCGLALADQAAQNGDVLLAVGEMGIGNTTAASVITAMLTHHAAADVTGHGTGVTGEAYERKQAVVELITAKLRARGEALDAMELLQSAGGLEIAAIVGIILGAARHHIAVIIDGFISTAAAAIAAALVPAVKDYLFASHQSVELGHRLLLEYLGLKPILQLDMRLGEGTGAVLAMPLIESAIAIYGEMATFSSASISGASE